MWGPSPLSVRRLRALAENVPHDGAVGVALGFRPMWTNTEELLKVIAELIDLGNRRFLAAHVKQGTPLPKAIEIRRPWERAPGPPPMASKGEMRAFFGPSRSRPAGEA